LFIYEVVHVGKDKLIGEVTSVSKDRTIIQVYENTSGIFPGEPIYSESSMLSMSLAPGLISNIYDGIGRPLKEIEKRHGSYIERGINIENIDSEKKWRVTFTKKLDDTVESGQIYATCMETPAIEHRLMIPYNIKGKIIKIAADGDYNINDTLLEIQDHLGTIHQVKMLTKCPIRHPRITKARYAPTKPLITGQRVIDTLFPIAKGGAAAIPGGFGTGKTMMQHQIAKWSDADIIVYIGCGERGNEMTQVLEEFSELKDPRSGQSMLDRTILIANTSNMPVAAREASIYTGVTMAEYYRDMGYHVAVIADSTSRWAEALREISGRLEEMPAEEGFPAYLPSKLSAFYERAGYYQTLNGDEGSITIIGAVSPQGNDFSEPVTQNTKRFIRCFWALDKSLAYARHYPAINWTMSYSEYVTSLDKWYNEKFGDEFFKYRLHIQQLLSEENSLMEIVKLIGADLLADEQKLILDISRIIRTGFLQQNANNKFDCYITVEKQFLMMKTIIELYNYIKKMLAEQIPISQVRQSGVYDMLNKMKFDISNDELNKFDDLWNDILSGLKEIELKYE
jgi:Archaeal/vacuolar-type H+-ATPase subunit A